MSDKYQVVTTQSWIGRIGNSIKGLLFGFIMFLLAFPLLFWNEGRSVKDYKTLKEGAGAVISVSVDKVDPANAGKLIHMTGQATPVSVLSDPVFNVSAKALKLKREVEMYQWKENKKSKTQNKLGGGTETVTTYQYDQQWSSQLINSYNFNKSAEYNNPSTMPYQTKEYVANDAALGAFVLTQSLLNKISDYKSLVVDNTQILPSGLGATAKYYGTGFYIGETPNTPKIGDIRITFQQVGPTVVSLIASQVSNTFEPYRARTGNTIELLQSGTHSAETMFQTEQESNVLLTWLLRLGGFTLMFIGLIVFLKPLSVIADVLPILGTIVGAGTALISFLIAALLSVITIAIAWVFYRPLLAIILIIIAGGLGYLVVTKLKAAKVVKLAQSENQAVAS